MTNDMILVPANIENFDEYGYMKANPDVENSTFSTGREHFLNYGINEDRKMFVSKVELSNMELRSLLEERQLKIVKHCNINGVGLEIGPSFAPIAPKKFGFNVKTIDHCSKEDLIKKYKNHPGLPENLDEAIEEVDFVWNGESYTELTGEKNCYDYIISSHLIEHVPNLISHLNDCSDLLVRGGVYSLAIPDKRYCFDYLRPITTIKDCIDQYLNKATNHSKGATAEYFLNVVKRDDAISWDKNIKSGKIEFVHCIDDAYSSIKSKAYMDIHQSIFTPFSFELLIMDLNSLGFIDFSIKSIEIAKIKGEFFVTLEKTNSNISPNIERRLELLKFCFA